MTAKKKFNVKTDFNFQCFTRKKVKKTFSFSIYKKNFLSFYFLCCTSNTKPKPTVKAIILEGILHFHRWFNWKFYESVIYIYLSQYKSYIFLNDIFLILMFTSVHLFVRDVKKIKNNTTYLRLNYIKNLFMSIIIGFLCHWQKIWHLFLEDM